MSGRGLGFTGGTLDKMESIPGMKTVLTEEEFFQVVNKTGLSVIGQSGNLALIFTHLDVTSPIGAVSVTKV